MRVNGATAPEESLEQELIGRDNFNNSNTVVNETNILSGDEKLVPP